MSSLLQHHGGRSKDGRKVELMFYRDFDLLQHPWPGPDTFPSTNGNGKRYPVLYRIYRRPAGMFGCWVVFRWNGQEHVPDLSVAISTATLPWDAKRVPDDEATAYWSRP